MPTQDHGQLAVKGAERHLVPPIQEVALYPSAPSSRSDHTHHAITSEEWSQYYRNVFRNCIAAAPVGRLPDLSPSNVQSGHGPGHHHQVTVGGGRLHAMSPANISTGKGTKAQSTYKERMVPGPGRRELYSAESERSAQEMAAPPRTAPKPGTSPRGVQRTPNGLVAPDRLLPLLRTSAPCLHRPTTGSDLVLSTATHWRHDQGVFARPVEYKRHRPYGGAAARGLGAIRRDGSDPSLGGRFKSSRGFTDEADSKGQRHPQSSDLGNLGRESLRSTNPRAIPSVPLVCHPL
eukprot:gnl/MRDRNA2_/MRDRNA2_103898_c0_seq1.p1 gnl/MRDRNA2_/MRDRNA2_103898_c0~~gnl/MRDRNA2_/MRDRNA2_103898_c0_seq1.p1  ORF type:complete len:312 (+),score=29.73 gnl/MRDRNA2_/MRDRNA2_103898_c0_seq1:65-937(+)